jgi:glucose dehydrogenase
MVIIGIVLAIDGRWLISLGGSFYCLPVGIAI